MAKLHARIREVLLPTAFGMAHPCLSECDAGHPISNVPCSASLYVNGFGLTVPPLESLVKLQSTATCITC
jgi:hypothetical protein